MLFNIKLNVSLGLDGKSSIGRELILGMEQKDRGQFEGNTNVC